MMMKSSDVGEVVLGGTGGHGPRIDTMQNSNAFSSLLHLSNYYVSPINDLYVYRSCVAGASGAAGKSNGNNFGAATTVKGAPKKQTLPFNWHQWHEKNTPNALRQKPLTYW